MTRCKSNQENQSDRKSSDALSFSPGSDEILGQLSRILSSKNFRQAPALKKFLRFVVEEKLDGRGSKLNVDRIAAQVFGRGAGFDNASDAIVRVSANRLRKALALYNATEGAVSDVVIRLEPGSYVPAFHCRTGANNLSRSSEALGLADAYNRVATSQAHAAAFRAVVAALKSQPEDGELLAAYAELSIDAHAHGFSDTYGGIDEACRAMETAIELAPINARVQFVEGLVALELGSLPLVEKSGRALSDTHHGDGNAMAYGARLAAIAVDPRDADEVPLSQDSETADQPGWLHHPHFLLCYQSGDYEGALGAAIAFGMPHFFGGHWSVQQRLDNWD